MATNKIHQLYCELQRKHGSAEKVWPQWSAARKSPKLRELIAIGAILTQRTSWHNADLALRNLKKEGLLSLEKIANLSDLRTLTALVRPAGFYQTKPKRLFSFCSFIACEYGSLEKFMEEELEVAREKLLALPGIGPETADTILLYAMDKPTFVIDEYTKRLVRRRGLATKFTYFRGEARKRRRGEDRDSYNHLKALFEKNLPCNAKLYQDFHALIIVEEKGNPGSLMKRV